METLSIIQFINYLTKNESLAIYITMLISFSFAISFFYRQGYKYLFFILKFPQLKSVLEHITIFLEYLQDLLSAILTLVNLYRF